MNRLGALEAFVKVVDLGNFSRAAEQLGLSRPAVSKYVSQLEDRLNTPLLTRTTRQVQLTELGRIYYDRVREILDQLKEADEDIAQVRTQARGALKVSAPTNFGSYELGPLLARFLERYPQITVELSLNDQSFDLIDSGFDLAVRVGQQPDSSYIIRKITSKPRILCASVEYLERHGEPRVPDDLFHHTCLCSNMIESPNEWRLLESGREVRVKVKSALVTSNAEVLRQAVVHGLGIAQGPAYVFTELGRLGQVKAVLPDYKLAPADIFVVYPSTRYVPPKVRVFIEFLVDHYETSKQHQQPLS